MAEGRDDAEKAFDRFLVKYQAKYDKAANSSPRIATSSSPSPAFLSSSGIISDRRPQARMTSPLRGALPFEPRVPTQTAKQGVFKLVITAG